MSGSALKRVLSRAQMRLADRSDACEGPGWARTEHMQQESGYVGGVPKMAAGADTTSYRPWMLEIGRFARESLLVMQITLYGQT